MSQAKKAKIIKPHRAYQPFLSATIPDEDSVFYEDFWQEEWDRCLNGYTPKGHSWIPGKYYFHMNHWKISRLMFEFDEGYKPKEKFVSNPIYRKFDHEFFMFLHECQAEGKNAMLGKFRRAGATDDCISYIAHDLLFFPKNQCGIGVPNKDKNFPSILPKFYTGIKHLSPELYQDMVVNNEDRVMLGFEHKDVMGNKTISGSESILFKRGFSRAGAFKGSWMKTLLMEEYGEHDARPTLRQCYAESQDCVMEGGNQFGMIILAGTSDKMNNLNNDHEIMWWNPDQYNLKTFFLPDTKWHTISKTGKYAFDFSTGESLEEEANADIEEQLKKYEQLPDKNDFFKFLQNHPRIPGDMFIVTAPGGLDVAKINERIRTIMSDPMAMNHVQIGDLVEDMDEAYRLSGYVKFVPNPQGHFRITQFPINHIWKNSDIGAVDDYQKSVAPESESRGAIVIWRRFINADIPCKIPVMVYWHRPPTLRQLYWDCLLAARYYQCELSFEMNTSQPDLSPPYEFFKSKNALHHLKQYPLILGKRVRRSEAFGYQVRQNEIAVTDLKLNDFISSPELNNVFDLLFLNQLAMTGRTNTDIISAFRVCLLYSDDVRYIPVQKVLTPEEMKQLPPEENRKHFHEFAFSPGKDGRPSPNWKNARATKKDFKWMQPLREKYGMEQTISPIDSF